VKFRNVLLLVIVGLTGVVLAATVTAVAVVLERGVRGQLTDELNRGQSVLSNLSAYRESLYRSEARLMAEEPRLKAVVDTQDINHETILGVALDLKKAVQSDLFLITDGTGRLLADVADPAASGFELGRKPVVGTAIAKGDAADVWTHDGHAYQVHSRRLTFGTTTVGVVVIGYEVDDRLADTVFRQTGDAVVILLGDKVVATSALEGVQKIDRAKLASVLADHRDLGSEPRTLGLFGTRYLAVRAPMPRTQNMSYFMLRSIDRALEPSRRLIRLLFAIAGAALLLATLLAGRLARRLSRPVDDLAQVTARVTAGDLGARAALAGPVELQVLAESMNRMVEELSTSRNRLAQHERLHRELEIATRIQTSMLPTDLRVAELEISAKMIPAEEVGGDYYDVLPVPGGAWIGIGDVAGHGLTAGLVMMMIQSIVAALVKEVPNAQPTELMKVLNSVLYDNIRSRLRQDEHVTMTLLRYNQGGRFMYAGAHEEIVVCRADTGRCDILPTPGTWLGAVEDISRFTVTSTLELRDGDVMALYSDGVIQAMDGAGGMFGMERLCAEIEQRREAPVEQIRDSVLAAVRAFTPICDDDVTLMIVRYREPAA
jgi:phosphoserine phosphatase RsbU/P